MNSLQAGYLIESAAAPSTRWNDFLCAATIAKQCFQSAGDPFQIAIIDDTIQWIVNTIPAYWNLIKYQGTVIGSTLLMPTSGTLMRRFLHAELTEADLFRALRQSGISEAECCYVAGAALLEPHRRRGLAWESCKNSIECFVEHTHPKPTFYCWAYSEQGRRFIPPLRQFLAAKGFLLLERQE